MGTSIMREHTEGECAIPAPVTVTQLTPKRADCAISPTDFYKDGKVVHQLSGIRGEVLPVFSVADGAVLQPNFGGSAYASTRPIGFQGIIKSMNLL